MDPQEHIGQQLQYLAVKLGNVLEDLEALDVMSRLGQRLVVQHPDDLQ